MDSSWRSSAANHIRKVIDANPGVDKKELRNLISAAYPYGRRKYHPYRIWLDEVKVQLGDKLPAWQRGPSAKARIAATVADKTVMDLFEEI